jgi:citronellol/citronellal dehydrogenase
VQNLLGGDMLMQMSRKPEIVADAAYYILSSDAATCTGNFFIDEQVLRDQGITDLDQYSVVPGGKLMKDIFLD